MGIKTVKYKANSIVYFKGDVPNRVYILKKGSIVTKATDLKTNDDILTMIKVGEFIGVKNVISNQPYSETVSTLTDSELVVFYKEDFESFIMTNSRIMMQTLVVFSNQLRKIHNDIKEINNQIDQPVSKKDSEDDLFELGKYFQKENKMDHSIYCFNKYKTLYPNGKYIDQLDSQGEISSFKESIDVPESDEDTALYYQEGINYFSENNFKKANECFEKVIDVPGGFHHVDAQFYNGAALFKLKKYKKCIRNYSNFLNKHKDHDKLLEVMFYVGVSYKQIGDLEQGQKFLKQVIKLGDSSPLAQLANKELKG